jgi:hypothetical protein
MLFVLLAQPAYAELRGLFPDLWEVTTEEEKVEALALKMPEIPPPKEHNIVGLEGYLVFSEEAALTGSVTWKHDLKVWQVGREQLSWRLGVVGAITGQDKPEGLFGPFMELDYNDLAGVVLIVRLNEGVRVIPGFKLNVLSWH